MSALLMGVVRRRFVTAMLVMAASGALLSAAAGRGTCATEPPPALDTVAAVNGDPLPRTILDRAFLRIAEHYVRFGPGLPIERMWSYRLDALSQAVDEQLVRNEARAHEVSVSADEVEAALDEMVNQYLVQLGGQGDDLETRLAQACAALGGPNQPTMSEPHFRAWLRDWLRPRYADEVTAALTMKQLKAEVTPLPPVTEDDLRAQFATVTLRTIAIRHTSGERLEEAAREARERAEDLLRQIRAGADFAALAVTASDDERYRATGGLEEAVLLSSVNPDRQKAVASLQVGEVSELIRTDMGYELSLIHISEPTRLGMISYAVFCLKKKKGWATPMRTLACNCASSSSSKRRKQLRQGPLSTTRKSVGRPPTPLTTIGCGWPTCGLGDLISRSKRRPGCGVTTAPGRRSGMPSETAEHSREGSLARASHIPLTRRSTQVVGVRETEDSDARIMPLGALNG